MTPCDDVPTDSTQDGEALANKAFARGQWMLKCKAKNSALLKCVNRHNEGVK